MRFSRVLTAVALVAVLAVGVAFRGAISKGGAGSRHVAMARARAVARPALGPLLIRGPVLRVRPDACGVGGGAGLCSVQACTLDITARIGPLGLIASAQSRLVTRPGLNADQVPVGGNCKGFIDSP